MSVEQVGCGGGAGGGVRHVVVVCVHQVQGEAAALDAVVCEVCAAAAGEDEVHRVQRDRRRQVDGEVEAAPAVGDLDALVAEPPRRVVGGVGLAHHRRRLAIQPEQLDRIVGVGQLDNGGGAEHAAGGRREAETEPAGASRRHRT